MTVAHAGNLNAAMTGHDLADLARQYGTDKVPKCPIYERYFEILRDKDINFLEIGIGGYDDPNAGGESLRMWKAYFAKAHIYGLDFYDKRRHAQERIKIYRGSQDDPAVLQKIASDMGRIDVILDDGSHVSAHIKTSFDVLFPLLAPGGIYIVEDIGTSYWPDFGGSHDFRNPNTSMAYFKRLADGIQHRHFKHKFSPTYADVHASFVHFYDNVVIIQKS